MRQELSEKLGKHFFISSARLDCLSQIILGLIRTRNVNLKKISTTFNGDALIDSHYRRLQRFFSEFEFNFDSLAHLLMSFFFLKNERVIISIDRTNWDFGVFKINIFMLSAVYKGISVPLIWSLLPKKGNSNCNDRIILIDRFIKLFDAAKIKYLLGDREFIGKQWLEYLDSHGIKFVIRIKENMKISKVKGDNPKEILQQAKIGKVTFLTGKRKLGDKKDNNLKLFFAATKSIEGELVIVVSNSDNKNIMELYALRWQIETLFSCMKIRGFNLEDTHLVHRERIAKMMAVICITFCWAHMVGEYRNELKKIKLKKHARKEISIFRYGLDYLQNVIFNYSQKHTEFSKVLQIMTPLESIK